MLVFFSIHCTVELLRAIHGNLSWTAEVINWNSYVTDWTNHRACCNSQWEPDRAYAVWVSDTGCEEDKMEPSCPRCLELMDLARGPKRLAELAVYQDQLEERGQC